jgi:hypothetical protein
MNMLSDGVYGLRFAATDGYEASTGRGLAVLRNGKILGSDPYGAVFEGSYEFDAVRSLNKVRLRLGIPPDGALLTGFSAGPDGATLDIVGAFAGDPADTEALIQVAGVPLSVHLTYLGPPPN